MADSIEKLKHQLKSAEDLRSVVHTLKVISTYSVIEYQRSVQSLEEYYQSLSLALCIYFRHQGKPSELNNANYTRDTCILVFGSDQGLAGQFNEVTAAAAVRYMKSLSGRKYVWAIGERMQMKLEEMKVKVDECFNLPNTIFGMTTFVGDLLSKIDLFRDTKQLSHFLIFYNRLKPCKDSEIARQWLLPLYNTWRSSFENRQWPGKNPPEIIGNNPETYEALIREYLFISLFRSCAGSLACEHSSRLAAMQRAEKNIDELSHNLLNDYRRLRQNKIDEELFDVVEGFEVSNAHH